MPRLARDLDLLTLKLVSESRGLPLCQFLVFLCLSFSQVRPNVRDRQTGKHQKSDRRQTKTSLNVSALWGVGITI